MAQDPRHPKSSANTEYPYNRVMVTESGHEMHWDDTPGKERIRIAHKSGSYEEWSPDGRKVSMVVGHNIQYNKGGITVTTDKNMDTKVAGSSRSNVSGDRHSETKGSTTSAVNGDSKTIVGGDRVSAVKGDSVTGVAGKMMQKVGGKYELKADGGMDQKVTGTHTIESSDSVVLKVGGVSMTLSGSGVVFSGGTITHDGKTIDKTHRHTDVMTGPDLTGPPA
jgi:hypothetical protein